MLAKRRDCIKNRRGNSILQRRSPVSSGRAGKSRLDAAEQASRSRRRGADAARACCEILLRSPGIQNFPARELETGDRRLEIGFAQRFLLHSDSFASISTRLQKRFWILTNQSLRLAFAVNVHVSKGSLGFPKVHRRASGIDKVQTS